MYKPDRWMLVKIQGKGDAHFYKVLGSWYGGYLHGDSWRLNSGIESCEIDGDYYIFNGYSGSQYKCHKDMYGVSMYAAGELEHMRKQKPELVFPLYKKPQNIQELFDAKTRD